MFIHLKYLFNNYYVSGSSCLIAFENINCTKKFYFLPFHYIGRFKISHCLHYHIHSYYLNNLHIINIDVERFYSWLFSHFILNYYCLYIQPTYLCKILYRKWKWFFLINVMALNITSNINRCIFTKWKY